MEDNNSKIEEQTNVATDLAATNEAVATIAAPKKRKIRKTVQAGQIHINATFNNTIITVTDSSGGVIANASAGSSGFRGSKKGTAYAAQVAVDKAVATAKQNNGLSRVEVFVKGVGQGRDSAIRAISAQNISIESIKDVTGLPHGGCRPRRAKRN